MHALSERLRKETASLKRRKGREAARQFLIEGVRSVEAAVLGGAQLDHVIVHERMLDNERVVTLLKKLDIPLYRVTDKQEKSITTVETSPGCVAVAQYKEDTLDDVRALQSVVVLDGVQDPGNAGTIIRTAAWFGIDAVILGAGSVDVYHPKTVRSTMGGLWDTHCIRVADISDALAVLREEGYTLYGTFMDGESLSDWQPAGKTALVIGSEARGVSEAVQKSIDYRLSIPGPKGARATESLNAATAASICMYVLSTLK